MTVNVGTYSTREHDLHPFVWECDVCEEEAVFPTRYLRDQWVLEHECPEPDNPLWPHTYPPDDARHVHDTDAGGNCRNPECGYNSDLALDYADARAAEERDRFYRKYPESAEEAFDVAGEVTVVNEQTGGEKGRKPQRMDLLPWDVLLELSEHYAKGAAKYDDHNWRKGYAWSLSKAAAQRHLAQFWMGEDRDPETGTKHVLAAAFHCLALAFFMDEHRELDDRPNTSGRDDFDEALEEAAKKLGLFG